MYLYVMKEKKHLFLKHHSHYLEYRLVHQQFPHADPVTFYVDESRDR